MASPFKKEILKLKCPKCGRSDGHWCRDEKGKAIHPHRERTREALKAVCSILTYVTRGRVA